MDARTGRQKVELGKVLKLVVLLLCVVTRRAATTQQAQSNNTEDFVRVEMRNIFYHFNDRIAVHISQLEGKLIPTRQGAVPVFDDKQSFVLALDSAAISISTDAMANVLNDRIFAKPDAPLKKVSISASGKILKIRGKLHSKGDISFEGEGSIAPTPEGQIRIHAEKVKAAHLPVKGIMDLLGVEVSDLIKTNKVRGIRAEGNDLILNPEQILPQPHIQGRVTDVQIKGNQIVQTFGEKKNADSGEKQPGNYMAYRGAQLTFGKLTMKDTDMILIDMDPKDPFDFYLDHYKDQLVAGYTKITPAFGLRVFMRDFNKLPKGRTRAQH